MKRNQMTFFISFWEAINNLPKKDQLPLFRAVVSYGLFGEYNETLSASQSAFFSLIQPVLDKSRKKAANRKQTENKPETDEEQNAKEKEGEYEKEYEKEYEREGDKEQTGFTAPLSGKPFTAFWEAYPSKIGRSAAWDAWKALNPTAQVTAQIMTALEAWKKSEQWTEDGGRFIPRAAKFLSEGHWKSPPKPAQKGAPAKRQLDEDEKRAIAQLMADDTSEAGEAARKKVGG